MSDDDKNGGWNANAGATLPNSASATYSIQLSPFFLVYAGSNATDYSGNSDYVVNYHGESGYYWPSTSSSSTGAYWPLFNDFVIWIAHRNARSNAITLRCLVSTNNR